MIAIYGLAALGAVLLFLGWAGFGIWPLELVGLVPLWVALERVLDRGWQTSLGIGWTYGTVAIAGGYHWMLGFTSLFGSFSLPASFCIFVAFSLFLGLQFGLQSMLYFWVRRSEGGLVLATIPPLVISEWAFPKIFPAFLGNALGEVPALVQGADLGGPLLLTAFIGSANLLVWLAIRRLTGIAADARASFGLLAFVAAYVLYGIIRIPQVEAESEAAPSIEVGLVQANIGVFEKHEQMLEGHRRHLEQSRELEQNGPIDLLIWPESAYVYPRLDTLLPLSEPAIRADLQRPILFGGLAVTYESGRRELYNSAFIVDSDGIIAQRYDKTALAMFGEYLPYEDVFPVIRRLSPNSGSFARGRHLQPLRFRNWRIATPICLEAALPDLVRKMVLEGDPHLLVNLTNDAWFGETQEPRIHLRLSQLRAVEHRRYLVRSTNSGISAVVSPTGRIVAQTSLGTRENLRARVALMSGATCFSRVGNWPAWASVLALVIGALTSRGRGLKERS